MARSSDSTIIDLAAKESRTVVTLDQDFPRILALAGALRPSVVLVRQQKLKGSDVAALIEMVWLEHEVELGLGCVIRVNQRETKLRRLPLR